MGTDSCYIINPYEGNNTYFSNITLYHNLLEEWRLVIKEAQNMDYIYIYKIVETFE